MNRKQDLYKVPIVSSWGAVTLINHEGLITPEHRWTAIPLDEKNLPIRPEDLERNPGAVKSVIVVIRRTGNPTPTQEEVQYAAAWKKALAPVPLADFIIICGASHYSFASEKVEGPGRMGF